MSGIIDPDRKRRRGKEIAVRVKSTLAVLLSLAILGGGGWFVYTKASEAIVALQFIPDYEGPGAAEVSVTIPQGSSTTDIANILVSAGVVESAEAFLNAMDSHPDAPVIQAGSYKLKQRLPAAEALEMLLDPESRQQFPVTIPEGLRLSQQLARIAEFSEIPLEDLEDAAEDLEELELPDYAPSAEGFLFPDTYEAPPEITAAEFLHGMAARYNQIAEAVNVEGRADALGITPLQLVTIASIIEREVRNPDDRPKVSRVIFNRLSQGMPLQMDSTVHYAVDDYSNTTTTDEQRETDSPYNTYVHEGLPPGPISAPGRASLEAAGSPEAGEWLYFVTVNLETGETRFAETLEDHEANVELFQQWCQQNPGEGC